MRWKVLWGLVLVVGLGAETKESETRVDDRTAVFAVESMNDAYGHHSDEKFSNGFSLRWLADRSGNLFQAPMDALHRFELPLTYGALPFLSPAGTAEKRVALDSQSLSQAQWTLTQDLYTPTDTAATEALLDDRPYAGLLYLAYTGTTTYRDRFDTTYVWSLSVGQLGDGWGEPIQNTFHRTFLAIPQAQGWKNHIDNRVFAQGNLAERRTLAAWYPWGEGTASAPRLALINQNDLTLGTGWIRYSPSFTLKGGYYPVTFNRDSISVDLGSGASVVLGPDSATGPSVLMSRAPEAPSQAYPTLPLQATDPGSRAGEILASRLEISAFLTLRPLFTLYNGTLDNDPNPFNENRYHVESEPVSALLFAGLDVGIPVEFDVAQKDRYGTAVVAKHHGEVHATLTPLVSQTPDFRVRGSSPSVTDLWKFHQFGRFVVEFRYDVTHFVSPGP